MPESSITLGVVGVGKRAIIHPDNLSYAWPSKSTGRVCYIRPMWITGMHNVLEKMYSRMWGRVLRLSITSVIEGSS